MARVAVLVVHPAQVLSPSARSASVIARHRVVTTIAVAVVATVVVVAAAIAPFVVAPSMIPFVSIFTPVIDEYYRRGIPGAGAVMVAKLGAGHRRGHDNAERKIGARRLI